MRRQARKRLEALGEHVEASNCALHTVTHFNFVTATGNGAFTGMVFIMGDSLRGSSILRHRVYSVVTTNGGEITVW